MIVDTSAIMAIILDEPEKEAFVFALARAGVSRLSAGSWIELSAVTTRRRDADYSVRLSAIFSSARITIAPVSIAQAQIGHDAYRRYGRGSGHPANFNLGDCFAYALAVESGESLLFKGDDFAATDVEPALR